MVPGDEVPPLLEVDGLRFGMMTCYDLRFPELARRLAVDGADALLVPAAWVKGPLKEHHWEVLATARALDNTCYVVAVGECGPRNIGASMVVDPLGVATPARPSRTRCCTPSWIHGAWPRRARRCRCWPTGASPAPNWPEPRRPARTRRPSTQGVAAEGSNSTTRSPR